MGGRTWLVEQAALFGGLHDEHAFARLVDALRGLVHVLRVTGDESVAECDVRPKKVQHGLSQERVVHTVRPSLFRWVPQSTTATHALVEDA